MKLLYVKIHLHLDVGLNEQCIKGLPISFSQETLYFRILCDHCGQREGFRPFTMHLLQKKMVKVHHPLFLLFLDKGLLGG